MKELTLENVQVDCSNLTEEQVKEMCKVYESNGYKQWVGKDALKIEYDYNYLRTDCENEFLINGNDYDKTTITYEKFMELFGNKEKSAEFDLLGYSVEVDNEEQARMLQESAFKQGFRWIDGEKILHTSKKYFQFKGKSIYWEDKHPDELKQIHFNNIFAPKYEVTMIAEKPKEFQDLVKVLNEELTEEAYKEKANKLNYELDFNFITQLAERMNANKSKYKPYNWQKLDNIEDLKQALFRHVMEVMKGNYEDDTRPYGHLEAIALNCMFINYQLNGK